MTAKSRAAHAAPAMAAHPAASLPTPSPVPPAPTAAAPAAQQCTPIGPSASALLCGLFERAQPALTDEDLSGLTQHRDTAKQMIGELADLCMGLGCMLSAEAGDQQHHAPTGCFQQPDDVARLLFLLSNVADQAHGLLQLASMADTVMFLNGRA